MEKVILGGYGVFITFSIIAIMLLIIRRRKIKKNETFEKREN